MTRRPVPVAADPQWLYPPPAASRKQTGAQGLCQLSHAAISRSKVISLHLPPPRGPLSHAELSRFFWVYVASLKRSSAMC